MGGTVYSPYTLEPLKTLGINSRKATKLAIKLHAHSIQCAYKLTSTRHATEEAYTNSHHQGQAGGAAS